MIPEFDKVFVVSDLHLGGPKGRRAFRETEALVNLIDYARTDSASAVAVVPNGDIVDFLAAGKDAPAFNLTAEVIVRALAADAQFKPIFDALGRLLRAPRPRVS
jgi:hypothetical protein